MTIVDDVNISADGLVRSTCRIELTNSIPPGQPFGISGRDLSGVNRLAISLYAPPDAILAGAIPESGPPSYGDGRTQVFMRDHVLVPPSQSRTVTFIYSVPGAVETDDAGRV